MPLASGVDPLLARPEPVVRVVGIRSKLSSASDRLVVDSDDFGVATPSLRVLASERPDRVRVHLRDALKDLWGHYTTTASEANLGRPEFHVTVTANLLLANASDTEFRVWFGQDFSRGEDRTLAVQAPVVVKDLTDLESIPTAFANLDFQAAFERLHGDSEVRVKDLICVVYLFKLVYRVNDSNRGRLGRHRRLWIRR